MNNCKHAGRYDHSLKICDCNINKITENLEAEEIRKSYMETFDENLIVHSSKCIFELEDSVEKCPFYEVVPS